MVLKRVKLKKSILVKEVKPGEALALDSDSDKIFQFSGDMARMMKILSDHEGKLGLSIEDLEQKLTSVSTTFRKNKKKTDCLTQTLQYLDEMEFLESRS